MLNIIEKRYWYFLLSLFLIVPGMIALGVWGLPLAIDFTGGSLLEVRFESGQRPSTEAMVNLYEDLNVDDALAQRVGDQDMAMRSRTIDESEQANLIEEMETRFDSEITVLRFETVGPSIGAEVAERASGAVGLATIGMLAYITFAFRGVDHAFRYGLAAVLAMLHDVALVVGAAAFLGQFAGWEVDALFLTAVLTVIGYSVLDSIVVFDRIRENEGIYRRLGYEKLVNHSVIQTVDRSLNTQLTVAFTLVALLLLGGVTTRHFVAYLLIGILSGTYSSIFFAAPLLVVWQNKEWRNWFGRGSSTAEA